MPDNNKMDQEYQNEVFQVEETISKPKVSKKKKEEKLDLSSKVDGHQQSLLPKLMTKDAKNKKNSSSQSKKLKVQRSVSKKKELFNFPAEDNLQGSSSSTNVKKRNLSLGSSGLSLEGLKHSKSSANALKAKEGLRQKIEEKFVKIKRQLLKNEKGGLKLVPKSWSEKVEGLFHHKRQDLEMIRDQQINRLNNKVKEWVIKLNDELDLKLNEVLRKKDLKKQTKQKNVEDIIDLLESRMLNNEEYLRATENEEHQLKIKEKQCASQAREKEVMTQIERIKGVIRESSKTIVKVKQSTQHFEEKFHTKPTSSQSQLLQMEALKKQLFKYRSEEEVNNVKLLKLTQKLQSLSQSVQNESQVVQMKLNEAKQNKIIIKSEGLREQASELKDKVERQKSHKMYSQLKISKNIGRIQQQIKLLKKQLEHYEQDIKSMDERISIGAKQTMSIIENHSVSPLVSHKYSPFFQKYKHNNSKNLQPFLTVVKSENSKLQAHPNKLNQQIILPPINQSKEASSEMKRLQSQSSDNQENEFMNPYKVHENKEEKLTDQTSFQKEQKNQMAETRLKGLKEEAKPSNKEEFQQKSKRDEQVIVFPKRFGRKANEVNAGKEELRLRL